MVTEPTELTDAEQPKMTADRPWVLVATMALDHSRLGLENKFFPDKITQLPT